MDAYQLYVFSGNKRPRVSWYAAAVFNSWLECSWKIFRSGLVVCKSSLSDSESHSYLITSFPSVVSASCSLHFFLGRFFFSISSDPQSHEYVLACHRVVSPCELSFVLCSIKYVSFLHTIRCDRVGRHLYRVSWSEMRKQAEC